jgi:hypothetical protein
MKRVLYRRTGRRNSLNYLSGIKCVTLKFFFLLLKDYNMKMLSHLLILMKSLLLITNILNHLEWQGNLLYTLENIVHILKLHRKRSPHFWDIAPHPWVIGAWRFWAAWWFLRQESSDVTGHSTLGRYPKTLGSTISQKNGDVNCTTART